MGLVALKRMKTSACFDLSWISIHIINGLSTYDSVARGSLSNNYLRKYLLHNAISCHSRVLYLFKKLNNFKEAMKKDLPLRIQNSSSGLLQLILMKLWSKIL